MLVLRLAGRNFFIDEQNKMWPISVAVNLCRIAFSIVVGGFSSTSGPQSVP